MPVSTAPIMNIAITLWRTTSRALSYSFAPIKLPIGTLKPTAAPPIMPFMSQFVLLVSATAAVALGPIAPTIAVSTYYTIIISICSSITGHASFHIILPGLCAELVMSICCCFMTAFTLLTA